MAGSSADWDILERMMKLKSFIDFQELFKFTNGFDNDYVRKYYKTNKYLLYRIFNHPVGYMHIGISDESKKYNKNFLEYQPRYIENLLSEDNFENVMEIGCGQSSNIKYLSKRFNNIHFTGLDLYPGNLKRDNVDIVTGDYHNLDLIADNSQDLIYAVETICYSKNKEKVYEEVFKKLKPGGKFIIFDAYCGKSREDFTFMENSCLSLIERGFGMPEFEYIQLCLDKLESVGFSVKDTKLNHKVITHMEDASRRVDFYMKHSWLFKVIFGVLPRAFLHNIVPVYMMETTTKLNLTDYRLIECIK